MVAGTIDPDTLPSVLAHIDECLPCRALVAGLLTEHSDDDSLDGVQVDHYRFGSLVAEGGMGRVYRAIDLDLDRVVAIKIPRANSSALRARFEREIAISVQLAHPGIVPLHGIGRMPDDTPFYVMRFVDGVSLDVALQ